MAVDVNDQVDGWERGQDVSRGEFFQIAAERFWRCGERWSFVLEVVLIELLELDQNYFEDE